LKEKFEYGEKGIQVLIEAESKQQIRNVRGSDLRDSEAALKKTVISGSDKIRAEIVIKV